MSTEYLYATSTHPEPLPYPVITISLSDIRNSSSSESNDEVFQEVLGKLDPYMGGEYILVVLAAESIPMVDGNEDSVAMKERRRSDSGLGWWLSKWRGLPHRCRKNLKRLYIVHPSPFTRTITSLLLPFLSPKAYAKLYPVTSVFDLFHTYGVSLSGIHLPMAVLEGEVRLRTATSNPASWTSNAISALGTVASYIPFSNSFTSASYSTISRSRTGEEGYWGRTLDDLVGQFGGVPPLFEELRRVILHECVMTEGIFRRTPGSRLRPIIVDVLDLPIESQPFLPWREIAISDPLLPPKILSRLFAKTSAPMIRADQYHLVRQCITLNHEILLPALSPSTRLILNNVITTLHDVSQHASETMMTPINLSICLAPDLIRSEDMMEDASLCSPPGKKMPQMGFKEQEGQGEGTLVGILELLIRDPGPI